MVICGPCINSIKGVILLTMIDFENLPRYNVYNYQKHRPSVEKGKQVRVLCCPAAVNVVSGPEENDISQNACF